MKQKTNCWPSKVSQNEWSSSNWATDHCGSEDLMLCGYDHAISLSIPTQRKRHCLAWRTSDSEIPNRCSFSGCWTMPRATFAPWLPTSALLLLHGWGNSMAIGWWFDGDSYARLLQSFDFHHIQERKHKKHLGTIVRKCCFNPPRQMQRTRSVSLDTFTPPFHTKHHAKLGTFPVFVSFWHIPGGSILQTDADAVFTKGTVLSLFRSFAEYDRACSSSTENRYTRPFLSKPFENQECEKVTTQNTVADVTTCVANKELPRDPCHPHLPCPTNQIWQSLSISIFKPVHLGTLSSSFSISNSTWSSDVQGDHLKSHENQRRWRKKRRRKPLLPEMDVLMFVSGKRLTTRLINWNYDREMWSQIDMRFTEMYPSLFWWPNTSYWGDRHKLPMHFHNTWPKKKRYGGCHNKGGLEKRFVHSPHKRKWLKNLELWCLFPLWVGRHSLSAALPRHPRSAFCISSSSSSQRSSPKGPISAYGEWRRPKPW